MTVGGIAIHEHLAQGGGGAVVEVGGGAPDFDEGRSVEGFAELVGLVLGADVVMLQVGVEAAGVAGGAAGLGLLKIFSPALILAANALDTTIGLGIGARLLRYASIVRGTSSGWTIKRMLRRPARTAVSAVSRTPMLIAGGVRCASSMLLVFLGLPMPSLRRSQLRPSTRASSEWQLAQLCQPWKQREASLK